MAIQAKAEVPAAAANGKHGHSLISDEKFRQLYELALRLRLHASGGPATIADREAMLAGVVADLRESDTLLLHDQASLPAAVSALLPHLQGGTQPAGTFAESVITAVSTAVADGMRKNGRVTVVCAGDRSHEPVLRDARRIAGRLLLPILFVEDWAGAARPSGKGAAAATDAMPSIPVDMHDVVAMYRVAHESISRARIGSGPTRILCMAHREAARRNGRAPHSDAVDKLEDWLAARGLPSHKWRRQMEQQDLENESRGL